MGRPAPPADGSNTVTITDNRTGKTITVPIERNSIPAKAFNQLKKERGEGDSLEDEVEGGIRVYDPGFLNTAVISSRITFIDGEKGILRYRGYPIEQLAEKSNFLETAYLLIYGELPSKRQFGNFEREVMHHCGVHRDVTELVAAFRYDAHPMAILTAGFAALGAFAPEANPSLAGQKLYTSGTEASLKAMDKQIFRLLGKSISLAACAYRIRQGRPFNNPPEGMGYTETFLYLLDHLNGNFKPNPVFAKALDTLFILHADHELNASAASMLQVGSTLVDPYSATAAATAALYGPLHGGAAEAVVRMLTKIGPPENVAAFIEKVKAKEEVLSGFGHRIYRTSDPRSTIILKTAESVFEVTGKSELLNTAMALREVALKDEYFIKRRLYPNVDFFSGLIYSSMGFPFDFFPLLFAVPRVVGWLAHWRQMMLQPGGVKIWRPRQLYVGEAHGSRRADQILVPYEGILEALDAVLRCLLTPKSSKKNLFFPAQSGLSVAPPSMSLDVAAATSALSTPLSPSRALNSASNPALSQLNAPPARKRLVLEQDDDFFAQAMLEEAEADSEEEDDANRGFTSEKIERVATPEISLNDAPSGRREPGFGADMSLIVSASSNVPKSAADKGKTRLVLEPDFRFEPTIESDEEMNDDDLLPPLQIPPAKPDQFSSLRNFSSRFGNLPSLNLGTRPGYIEQAPLIATSLSGKRITFPRRKRVNGFEETAAQKREDTQALANLADTMLEIPYHQMFETIQNNFALAKKQAEADATNGALDILMDAPTGPIENTLWTDRYRPKRFTDLLGDERVHRQALEWLKEWDSCVFKGSAKTSAAEALKRERRKKRQRENAFGNWATKEEPDKPLDPFGRPQEKILLLAGPPGLGKTTLAYVLARQAGYQILEVNASDDRTGKVVEERIRNALESRALSLEGNAASHKPTCVVIDEIDGAGGGGESSFVRTLVKLVNEGTIVKKHKGKGKKDRPLMRPIICICNDLYAPILRPLRALAKIIKFTAPTYPMLVHRLRTICQHEGISAETKNLTLLAEVAEGDLRSCLNTLQFIKRKTSTVDDDAIRSTIVGMKDTGTSCAQVIERLFKKPPRKKGGGNGTSDDKFLNRIVRDVQTCGEFDKIAFGVFENYLTAKQVSDSWSRVSDLGEWLNLFDLMEKRVKSERDYELFAYFPFMFAPTYKLFSNHEKRPLEFPKTDYEMYLKRVAHQEILQQFSSNIPQPLKTLFTGANIGCELIPFINRIISPELKPVNAQLIKMEEKQILSKLVQILLGMKLNFVHDRNEEGQLIYKLEPAIDVFIHFDGKRAEDVAPSRYAVRHLIVTEMENESLRRLDPAAKAHSASDILSAYKTKTLSAPKADAKEAVDFFGRAIVHKLVEGNTPGVFDSVPAPPAPRAPKAVYRYHEGFSNAVRVTKRVADFLV